MHIDWPPNTRMANRRSALDNIAVVAKSCETAFSVTGNLANPTFREADFTDGMRRPVSDGMRYAPKD